jgi:hypothetical protein
MLIRYERALGVNSPTQHPANFTSKTSRNDGKRSAISADCEATDQTPNYRSPKNLCAGIALAADGVTLPAPGASTRPLEVTTRPVRPGAIEAT